MSFEIRYHARGVLASGQLCFWLLYGTLLIVSASGCSGRAKTSSSESATNTLSAAVDASLRNADAIPGQVTQHPIDALPQGKEYREATNALDAGKFEVAEAIRAKLASDPDFSVLATAIEALAFVKQGQFQKAIELAETVSSVPVMQGESYAIAGEVFYLQKNWTAAIDAFSNSLEINPQHVRSHRWLGIIYYDSGAMRLATQHLRRVADLDGADTRSLFLSGRIHCDYEQYEEAIRDYQRLLEREPASEMQLAVRVTLSDCLCELRRLAEAREAVKSCPEVAAVFVARAAIEEAEGQFKPAIELANRALRLNPENTKARLILGRIHVTQREWSSAIEVLQETVKQRPYDHEARLLLGRALMANGDKIRGEAEINEATRLKDTFLRFSDMHHDAIQEPYNVEIRVELGQLAEQLGKDELAESWYTAALGLQPDHKTALELLDRLRAKNAEGVPR